MKRALRILATTWMCLASTAFIGCVSTNENPAPPISEENVNPSINDNFKDGEMDPSQWVERFEREGREVYDQRNEILDAVGVTEGMEVADVGCGTGLYTFLFADQTGPEGRVYAVDIAPSFLDLIGGKAVREGRKNIQTVLATDTSCRLPEKSVDLVYLCDTYHHFEYPLNTLRSINKALRPGGQLVVIDFIREEGVSSEWTLNHVRAGQAVVTEEITAAGFELVEEVSLLQNNYFLRFRKSK